ncbi:MAG: hypothetical protein DHS20C11_15750 [Lysobacteraceae bacterium]|nr:MAG: hypothetical protein DHS20C11_15750 [Xanthomonadaceae bacterium]
MKEQAELDTIGERLRYAREQADLSQAELRHRLANSGVEVSRARLWNYENRPQTIPKPQLLIAIGKVTGFSPGWLYCGTGLQISNDALDQLLLELSQAKSQDDLALDLDLLAQIRRLPPKFKRALKQFIDAME